MVERPLLEVRKRPGAVRLGRVEVALAQRQLAEAQRSTSTGPGGGAPFRVPLRGRQVAAVELDLGEVGERRGPPVRALELGVHGRQLLLQRDRAIEIAREARDLASSDERLGETAFGELVPLREHRLDPFTGFSRAAVRDEERVEGADDPGDLVGLAARRGHTTPPL